MCIISKTLLNKKKAPATKSRSREVGKLRNATGTTKIYNIWWNKSSISGKKL